MFKQKFSLVVLVVLVILAALLPATCKAQTDTVILDWFTLEYQTYGPNTITVDFYFFEDLDPNSYIGTINFKYDQQAGKWDVDEYVDLLPYTDPYTGEVFTEDQIFQGMEYFAQSALYMLDSDPELIELTWSEGIPQQFSVNPEYWNLLMTVQPLTYTVFLPIVLK